MKNLLDFETFRLNEWNKIIINKDKEGKITFDPQLDNTTTRRLERVLVDSDSLIYQVTGGYNRNNFSDNLINNGEIVEIIRKLKFNTESHIFPENETYVKFNDNELSDINKLFPIEPPNKKTFGKGELLLSSYYSNVFRNDSNDESGDCHYFTLNENGELTNQKKYIEVKTGGSSFTPLYVHKKNNGEITKIIKEYIRKNPNVTINEICLYECIGGLALYLSNEVKDKDLFFVVFDNKYDDEKREGEKTTNGYFQKEIINKEADKIYKELLEVCELGDNETKDSQDHFFIEVSANKNKLTIRPRKEIKTKVKIIYDIKK